jgi:hypothetical protein
MALDERGLIGGGLLYIKTLCSWYIFVFDFKWKRLLNISIRIFFLWITVN